MNTSDKTFLHKINEILITKINSKVDFTNTSEWIWLLKLLRFTGQLPISISSNDDDDPNTMRSQQIAVVSSEFVHKKVEPTFNITLTSESGKHSQHERNFYIDFHYISKATAYTVCIGLLQLSCTWYLRDQANFCRVSKEPTNSTQTSVIEGIVVPVNCFGIPLICTLQWLSLMFTPGYFCQFLNNWENFDSLELLRNGNFNAVGPCKLQIAFFISLYFLASQSAIFGVLEAPEDGELAEIELAFFWGGIHMLSLIEDMKVAFMLLSVTAGFQKVRLAIVQQIKELQADSGLGTREKRVSNSTHCNGPSSFANGLFLNKYHRAVKFLQEQAALISTCQGTYEILYLIYLTFTLTSTTFILISGMLRGEYVSSKKLVISVVKLCVQFGRLFLKCHLAEKVTNEEKRIAEELINWDTTAFDMSEKLEVKSLVDSIIMTPTKIIFCSVLPVDKRLLITIGSQMLTFIIILLQFQQSSKTF